ncbi:putative methyltransferase-domain-containing protein [Schizophyllum fasciatum]
MPKARKKKAPVTGTGPSEATSGKPETTRTVIRRFHVLLKRRAQLEQAGDAGKGAAITAQQAAAAAQELARIDAEVEALGGLEKYQEMSAIGQSSDRGGGSEKVLIGWLKELGIRPTEAGAKLRLLEVGALKPDNYKSCQAWIDPTPIDLHSRHPSIKQQDFLAMDEDENRAYWDIISLSLVVNFVPDAKDRGRMLRLAHTMLKPSGLLFLALPLPCILNSRYTTPDYVQSLMEVLGFSQLRSRWREGGKMAYWLYTRKQNAAPGCAPRFDFERKIVLRTGNRNNFAILL